jgi:hypothetical protein
MMAKNSEFEEEMRKSDTAAYRAGLADEPGTESTAAFMKRTGTKSNRPKATVGGPKIVTKDQMKKEGFDNLRDYLKSKRKHVGIILHLRLKTPFCDWCSWHSN